MPFVSMKTRVTHCKPARRLTRIGGSILSDAHPLRRKIILLGSLAVLLASVIIVPQVMLPSSCSPTNEGGFLRSSRGRLVNAACQEVQLTGVNWFGMETSSFAPHGLDVRNWQAMLDQMVEAGFNTIRLPFSNQFLDDPTALPQGINYQLNPDLRGLRGLSLLDKIVEGARERGLKIILDRHRPTADGQSDLWYTDQVPESRWIADWVMLAKHYRGNDTIIGADLHNEPHGPATWGTGDPATDWRLAAERAGNAILKVNPDWLIIVQGIEQYHGDWYWWGGNLEGAGQYPVELSRPDKLVYSIHDYGPEVYPQSWFWASDFPRNLIQIWVQHWAYLQLSGQATVLVGEFGARSVGRGVEGMWLNQLLAFMKAYSFSYAYWAWNPDSGDTGGLLEDDWKTLNPTKLAQLSTYQCPLLSPPAAATLSSAFRDQLRPSALFRKDEPGLIPPCSPTLASLAKVVSG
ncbi:MAG TPA: glycoside hydrolase family 5 protein [Ktedonobacterales bacterium]|nr:glycoside hydrolase family 5 protein [Ktedonobacterales bacterium]